jgi:hypothetical protein
MHAGPSISLEIRERLWQWHLKPLKFIPKNPQTDPSNIKTFIGGKERWFQKRKRKKRDRKEGLLDLLEKEKQKTRALQTWKAFDVPVLFLFFFYKLLLFFFKKKKTNQSRDWFRQIFKDHSTNVINYICPGDYL